MAPTIAIVAQGEMGSATGRRLVERGARVITSLAGRSAASRARAEKAGMVVVDSDDELVTADYFLSIVPPGDAVAMAERLKPALGRAAKKPVYVDCNAVAPETAGAVGTVLAPTGCPYVDGGIIGPPPGPSLRTVFYASGAAAKEFEKLSEFGLMIRVVDGPIGAASAVKMSYAGITKGFTAIGAAMMIGAARGGTAATLHQEMLESQPHLLEWLARQVPRMFSKAYRFVGEMEEIAAFLEDVPAGSDMYVAIAKLYEHIAEVQDAERKPDDDISHMARFCTKDAPAPTRKSA
jgi:3-hydroxyisobutyrate dehydrogenase-like beta-hydroxyacid dehydrogenase